MIILLKGVLSVLDYFIDHMAEGSEDTCVLDITDGAFAGKLSDFDAQIDETTDVILFNNVGLNLGVVRDGREQNYWEFKGVRLHNIYVDAPIWYKNELANDFKCMQVITVDGYHRDFIRKYFPGCASAEFLPHGGVRLPDAEQIPYEQRPIDVLYVGTRRDRSANQLYASLSPDNREIFDGIREILMRHPHMTPEGVFDMYMGELGAAPARGAAVEFLYILYAEALDDVRSYYQGKIVETLASAGISIEIYGEGNWGEIAERYPDSIHVNDMITPEECIRMMCRSKVTLNILPWFKYGAHERIYNAMLNGSVCVSDASEYLVKHFEPGKNIVLYELNHLDLLAEKVQRILGSPGDAERIIENQKRSVAHSTWADRLQNIIEQRFDEGKDFI